MSDRRSSDERRLLDTRRRARERKRASNETHTVIEIASADLRAVTLARSGDDATDQVRVMTLRWRIEAAALNTETGLSELTAALKELAEKNDLQT